MSLVDSANAGVTLDTIPAPPRDGVYGPMIFMSALDGECGVSPAPPVTNAFLVWVGFPLLVVSEGVLRADSRAAAAQIRRDLAAPDLAILFTEASADLARPVVRVDTPAPRAAADLARAAAFVILQCTLFETDTIVVDVEGERIHLACDHEAIADGRWWPRVRVHRTLPSSSSGED